MLVGWPRLTVFYMRVLHCAGTRPFT
jgi:hypothetical protein